MLYLLEAYNTVSRELRYTDVVKEILKATYDRTIRLYRIDRCANRYDYITKEYDGKMYYSTYTCRKTSLSDIFGELKNSSRPAVCRAILFRGSAVYNVDDTEAEIFRCCRGTIYDKIDFFDCNNQIVFSIVNMQDRKRIDTCYRLETLPMDFIKEMKKMRGI